MNLVILNAAKGGSGVVGHKVVRFGPAAKPGEGFSIYRRQAYEYTCLVCGKTGVCLSPNAKVHPGDCRKIFKRRMDKKKA